MSKVKIFDLNRELMDASAQLLRSMRVTQQDMANHVGQWRQLEETLQAVQQAQEAAAAEQQRDDADDAAEQAFIAAEIPAADAPQPQAEPSDPDTLISETQAAGPAEGTQPASQQPAARIAPKEPAKPPVRAPRIDKPDAPVRRDVPIQPRGNILPGVVSRGGVAVEPARPVRPQQPPVRRPLAPTGQGPAPRMGGGPLQRPAPRPGFVPRQPGAPMQGQGPGPRRSGPPLQRTLSTVLAPTQEKERVSNYDPNKQSYTRNYEAEKRQARTRRNMNVPSLSGDDDLRMRGARKGKHKLRQKIEPIRIEKAVITTELVGIRDLAEKIGKPASEIIKKLFILDSSKLVTINHDIDFDTAQLIAAEYDIALEQKLEKTFEEVLTDEDKEDAQEDLVSRPPVVTIMGHVDHGKTTLLDAIRSARVTASEAGGITQHIGAYSVNAGERTITFVDTPGHEAFTAMRARGAQVTDIAIIVVAADDGVMPQTVEAINHVKAAGVPIIVAINKVDRPDANPERVKQQMTEYGLVAEEWGGDTIFAPVSAITHEGIDNLLEMILLVADVQDFRANPNRLAKGVIIEARLDKGRGPVATVLIQNGTLRVGNTIVAGTAYGRVRAMLDDSGQRITEAVPSQPVEVLGFSDVPEAGDIINAVEAEKLSRQVAEERRDKIKAQQALNLSRVSLDDLFSQISQGDVKDLNIVIKADVQGSVEAVRQSLEKLSNDQVKVRVIHGGVGAITESDIMLASASNAIIIGFNVRPDAATRAAAEREKVDIRLYRVIYNAIEDIEKAMKGMLAPVIREVVLGRAQVRTPFRVTGVGMIAGSYVQDGLIRRNAQVRVLRDSVVVHEGRINSLKRFKEDVREVAQGYECGIGIEDFNDIKEGDVLEAFINEQVEQS